MRVKNLSLSFAIIEEVGLILIKPSAFFRHSGRAGSGMILTERLMYLRVRVIN